MGTLEGLQGGRLGPHPDSSVGLRLMYGCMPISPEIVEDAESLTTWFPFSAASAKHNLLYQSPIPLNKQVGAAKAVLWHGMMQLLATLSGTHCSMNTL